MSFNFFLFSSFLFLVHEVEFKLCCCVLFLLKVMIEILVTYIFTLHILYLISTLVMEALNLEGNLAVVVSVEDIFMKVRLGRRVLLIDNSSRFDGGVLTITNFQDVFKVGDQNESGRIHNSW